MSIYDSGSDKAASALFVGVAGRRPLPLIHIHLQVGGEVARVFEGGVHCLVEAVFHGPIGVGGCEAFQLHFDRIGILTVHNDAAILFFCKQLFLVRHSVNDLAHLCYVAALVHCDVHHDATELAPFVVDDGVVDRLGIGHDDDGVVVRFQCGVEEVDVGGS